MTTTKQFRLGSVSTGTLRTEDLLPAFLFALEGLSQTKGTQFNTDLIEQGFGYSQCGVAFGSIADWPISEDEAQEIIEELQEALNELCPLFVFFGTLEGDGANFGFWVDMDRLENEIGDLDIDNDGEYVLDNHIVRIEDRGSDATLMDMERNVIWSTV